MNVTHATETAATGTGGAAAIPPTRNEHLKWIFSLLCAAVILAVCVVAGLSRPACWFFSLTVLAICLWGFSLLPDGLVAVMLPMGYILSGVGTPAQVLSPWTKPMGWMILGGLMTGLVLQHTGLARRIALWALHVTGSSFRRLLWGILLAGFIIAPLMPTSTGKCILLGIICIGICDAMGFKARSREASTLLMAGYLAVAGPRMGLYTGAGEVTLNLQMLATAGVHVSWLEYFLQNFAPSVVYSVLSIVVLRLVMRPKSTVDARVWVEEQYAGLGPMSLREKKALALFAVLAVLMMTDKWHGINIGWIMMVVGFVGFLPGFDLVDGKKFATLKPDLRAVHRGLHVHRRGGPGHGHGQEHRPGSAAPAAGQGRAGHGHRLLPLRGGAQLPAHAGGRRKHLHRAAGGNRQGPGHQSPGPGLRLHARPGPVRAALRIRGLSVHVLHGLHQLQGHGHGLRLAGAYGADRAHPRLLSLLEAHRRGLSPPHGAYPSFTRQQTQT